MFSLPSPNDPSTVIDGQSDDNPLCLQEDITPLQFTHFLSCVYPRAGSVSLSSPLVLAHLFVVTLYRYAGPTPSTLEDWMGVYSLAATWAFESVRLISLIISAFSDKIRDQRSAIRPARPSKAEWSKREGSNVYG